MKIRNMDVRRMGTSADVQSSGVGILFQVSMQHPGENVQLKLGLFILISN